MALMSTRAINLNDVLNYELAAVPTSIFDEKSGLRISTSKSILKRNRWKLPIRQSVFEKLWLLVDVPDSVCSNGPAKDSSLICHQQDKQLQRTHAIFDRYNTSIKDATRCQRAWEAAREYKLTMNYHNSQLSSQLRRTGSS